MMARGRAPCCDKEKVKRGPWSSSEDLKLTSFIHKHGYGNWRALPKQAGLLRCGKSCRLRWINYLRPDVKRGKFSPQEEEIIINLHTSIGNKWSKIASCLPGRTDNEIKNVWNTYLKKRALKSAEETSASASSSHSTSCSIISSGGYQKKMENCSNLQECVKNNEQKEHSEYSHCAPYSSRRNNVDGDGDLTHCEPFEIPMENADIDDFWNSLDSLETSNESSYIARPRQNDDCVGNDKLLGEPFEEELQNKRWLRNLEFELGLVAETGGCDNTISQPDQCTIFDAQYQYSKSQCLSTLR